MASEHRYAVNDGALAIRDHATVRFVQVRRAGKHQHQRRRSADQTRQVALVLAGMFELVKAAGQGSDDAAAPSARMRLVSRRR